MVVFAPTGLVALALQMGAVAPEEGPTSLAVAPIALEGTAETAAREQLTTGLLDGLGRGPLRVIPPQELESAPANGCADAACLADIAAKTGATYVVQGKIVVDERDYSIEIVLTDPKGNAVSTLTEQCDICGIDEVVELIADLAGGMQSKLETLTRSAPMVNVSSTPAGAQVFIDDKLVGMTPYTGNVTEGKHKVRLELDGYIVRERTVNGVEGTREDVSLKLERVPTNPARRKGLIVGGAVGIGLGVAMIGGGVPLLLIDGNQNKNDCKGDNVDVNGLCRYSYNTMAGGIGLVAGGAVLAAVGVGLLARARIERKNLEAQAFIGPRGIAIVGRF